MVDPAYAHLPEALEEGAVTEEALDASVRRVLEAKLRMGLFDEPYVDVDHAREVLADPAHREVARRAAERSAVLLRNADELAPARRSEPEHDRRDRTAGRLQAGHDRAVGLRFRSDRDGNGAGRHPGQGGRFRPGSATRRASGPRNAFSRRCSTCSAATRRRIPKGSTMRPSCGARSSWLGTPMFAIVVVGEWQNMIGEAASRSSLELPGRQLELLQADRRDAVRRWCCWCSTDGRSICAGQPKTCRPSSTSGTPAPRAATAVANVLFGDVAPGGKLPFTLAAHRRPGADGLLPHDLARAGEAAAAVLGRGEHATVPVRSRSQLCQFRVPTT